MGLRNTSSDGDNLKNPASGIVDVPRPLDEREAETISALLESVQFDGSTELLAQLPFTTVISYCGCGCASIKLSVSEGPQAAPPRNPLPCEASVDIELVEPEDFAGLMLWHDGGYLDYLEIYAADTRTALPPIEYLKFFELE